MDKVINKNMSKRICSCQKNIKEMYDEVLFLRTHAYDIFEKNPSDEVKNLECCYQALYKAFDLMSAARRFYDGDNTAYAKHLAKTAGLQPSTNQPLP